MDYEGLIGQQVQTIANSLLTTVDNEVLYFDAPPTVRLIEYDLLRMLFICDLQTGDEHDGKRVFMSAYAVEQQLGLID